jgi:hypothetical protein
MSGTSEKVTFNGQAPSNSYGYVSSGYDGFVWADVLAMGRQYVDEHEPDTGFASTLRGEAVGYTAPIGYGAFYNLSQSFTLKSAIFASAWDSKQPVVVAGYGYDGGVLQKEGSVVLYLNQTAQTVNFAHYGKAFKNLALVLISVYPGIAGKQGYYGYQVAMDNLRVRWDGPIPAHHGPVRDWHGHEASHMRFVHCDLAHAASHAQDRGAHDASTTRYAYHSQLLSWGHDPGSSGLAAKFTLPAVEHVFGN